MTLPAPGTPLPAPPNRSGVGTDALLVEQWLALRQSDHTREAYARDVRDFLAFAGRPALGAVTLHHLQAWQGHLADSGRAASTVNRKLASLRSLLTHGHQTGYLQFNVGAALRPRRTPDRLAQRILPERDVLNLLAAAGGTPRGPRNEGLLSVLYYTGCRVSEALGLQWRDLRLGDGIERPVAALHGKGGQTRHVGLPPVCAAALRRLRPSPCDPGTFIFTTVAGRRLTRHEAAGIVKAAARRAGIELPVSPHWLRHAHATHALDRGAPAHLVQATLGHASLTTTSRYVHVAAGESSGHTLAGANQTPLLNKGTATQ